MYLYRKKNTEQLYLPSVPKVLRPFLFRIYLHPRKVMKISIFFQKMRREKLYEEILISVSGSFFHTEHDSDLYDSFTYVHKNVSKTLLFCINLNLRKRRSLDFFRQKMHRVKLCKDCMSKPLLHNKKFLKHFCYTVTTYHHTGRSYCI